jgi:hypothetical protein
MTTYAALANRQEHKGWFYIKIAGIPYVYGSVRSLTIAGYTYKGLLKKDSIKETADKWQLKTGSGSGGSLSLTLINADDHFNALLATDLASMHSTRLTADMAYSDSAGETIHVEDTTGFAAAGTIYVGLETVTYTGTTATTFTGCQRAALGSWGSRHKIVGAAKPESDLNPVVTDQPVDWTGRWLELYHGFTDEHAHASDAKLVWRGVLQEPQWGEGCLTVEWKALSLLTLFQRNVCGESIETSVPYATGDAWDYYGDTGVKDWYAFYFFDEDVLVSATYLDPITSDPQVAVATIPAGVYSDVDDILGCSFFRGLGTPLNLAADVRYVADGMRARIMNNAEIGGTGVDIIQLSLPPGVAEALGFPGYTLFNLNYATDIEAEDAPALSYQSAKTRKIYVSGLSTIGTPTLPNGFNNCYAIETDLGDGPIWEVVRVMGTGTDGPGDPAPGKSYIEVGQRGRGFDQYAGKGRAIFSVPDMGLPKIRRCVFMKNVNYLTALRYFMCSTDGSGYNGDYDVLPEGVGAAIPSDFLYATDWQRGAELGELRNYLFADPASLWELLSAECALLGLQLYLADGQIGVRRIGVIAASESVKDFNEGHLQGLAPRIVRDAGMQIGSLLWSCNYNGARDEFGVEDVNFQSAKAVSFQRPASEVAVQHRGYWSNDGDLTDVLRVTQDLFARFELPPCCLELFIPHHFCWAVDIGETIRLTHSRLVSPYSAVRGVTNLALYVYSIERNWSKLFDRLLCLVPRLSSPTGAIAPSAKVKSYTAHVGSDDEVELYADTFSVNDLTYFRETGLKVKILREADESVTYEGVSAGLSGSSILLPNPCLLSDGNPPADGDIVRYCDRADVALTTSQLLFTAVADYTTELLAGTDAAFLYG